MPDNETPTNQQPLVHTPGPWEVRDWDVDADGGRYSTVDRRGELDVIGDSGTVALVCTDVSNGAVVKEHDANAKLIADAPVLLKELENLYRLTHCTDMRLKDGMRSIDQFNRVQQLLGKHGIVTV